MASSEYQPACTLTFLPLDLLIEYSAFTLNSSLDHVQMIEPSPKPKKYHIITCYNTTKWYNWIGIMESNCIGESLFPLQAMSNLMSWFRPSPPVKNCLATSGETFALPVLLLTLQRRRSTCVAASFDRCFVRAGASCFSLSCVCSTRHVLKNKTYTIYIYISGISLNTQI